MKYKCSNCGKEFHCQPDRDEHERECVQPVVYLKYTMDRDSTLTTNAINNTEWHVGDAPSRLGGGDWSRDGRRCSVWMPENTDMEKVCEILKKEIIERYPYFMLEFPLDKSSVDFGLKRFSEKQHNAAVTYVPEENAVRFWHKGGEVEAAVRHDREWLKNPYIRIWKYDNGLLPVSFFDSVDKEGVVQRSDHSDSIGCRKEDAKEAYQKLIKSTEAVWRVMFDADALEMTVAEVWTKGENEQLYKVYTMSDGTAYMYVPKEVIDVAKAEIRQYVREALIARRAEKA